METEDTNPEELQQDELETLKSRAALLGVKHHPSIGADNLRKKIEEHLAEDEAAPVAAVEKEPAVTEPVTTAVAEVKETDGQRRVRLKREAIKLVRLQVTCMNPAKREWNGEFITVANRTIGTITKYIPYDTIWHVPTAIYHQLIQRQCQIFTTVKDSRGNKVRKGKMIKEFSIDVLPNLTQVELKELAQQQTLAHSIDN